MQPLMRGQKLKWESLSTATSLQVGLSGTLPTGSTIDYSCFGVDENGKLSDDRYFIFYNQRTSPCGALASRGAGDGDAERFAINLAKLPTSIRRLIFVMTIDGPGAMGQLTGGHWRLQGAGGNALAEFPLRGSDFGSEKALIVGELYRKDDWRLAAVGQGFNGGLGALLKHFGGEEVMPDKTAVNPAPVPDSPPSVPPSPKVSLTKITLEKKGDKQTVDLRKGGGVQPIHVNLNWDNPGARKRGFFAAPQSSADLDLGCMYGLKNREAGVIQPLGRNFGARNRSPFIFLDKDDRSGAAADGENLYLFRPDLIDLVMVFAMIYQGASNFTQVGGRLTLRDQNGSEIYIQLSSPDRSRNFCAICTIRNAGDRVEITKEEQYFHHHGEADRHFGFGFKWVAGSK
jgi:tellurite resistance protein TerA